MDGFFDHERLEVYRVARGCNVEVARVAAGLGRGQAESRDNLVRASKSIGRNIAEGAGKWRLADKIHFYHIARGSATECAASLDELVDFGAATQAQVDRPKEVLARVVAMLIAMIRSLEARDEKDMRAPADLAPRRGPPS
jgi:four helix bundle protein